ncbi:hypothetical protein KJ742_00220 [Patescibacteria group bacterium]|nr:hypothetical protein [Patescibacteria group bacterium]MBU1935406.1 hypothetical protein [Patescibacteria group bacterium]
MIDKLIRLKVHHGRAIELLAAAGILIVLGIVYFATPFFEILGAATPTMKILIICLLAVMLLIYITTTRKVTRMVLEKKVHRYIYFILSIIFFVFIVIMADQSFNSYQNYINTQFVDPTIKNIQFELDEREEKRLLTLFREDYLEGRCEQVDYSEKEEAGLTHFVYITTDIEFATMKTLEQSMGAPTIGYECTDGINSFILTDEGKWYWVIAE